MEKEKKVKQEEKVTPPVEETKEEEKETPVVKETETKKKKTGLILLVVILFLIIITLIAYILYPHIKSFIQEILPNSERETTVEDTEEELEEVENASESSTEETPNTETPEEEDTSIAITGDIVSATIPEGWNLVEYMDGDGTTMLSGGTYTGLTGLKIFNPQNENVFSLEAVSGIGFVGCGDYAKFNDESEAYFQEQVNNNSEAGVEMEIHDYTSTPYAEFDWLGTTMRRITDLYYYDTLEGNNYFEPPCVPGLIVLEGLTFEDSYGYVGEAYFYGLEDIAEVSEYEIVDEILESMETV